jgi:hypothetical protein
MSANASIRRRGVSGERVPWTSSIARTAVLVALSVALGFLLISVPNVELLTFSVFVSGAVLGRWRGALVGALAMAIYSGTNPYGSGLGFPPLYAAQILSAAFTGFTGGLTAGLWRSAGPVAEAGKVAGDLVGESGRGRGHETRVRRGALAPLAGFLGLLLTSIYQGAVIFGVAVASPELRTGVFAAIAANAFFSVIHVGSNAVLFAVLAPVVIPRLKRLMARGTSR